MASALPALSEEHFLCSICMHVLCEPVSIPCGHNFCLACLTQHWDAGGEGQCQCPLCKTAFSTRPQLQVNTLLAQIAAPFRTSAEPTEQDPAEPAGEPCDLCTGAKVRAVRSCLVCEASYCAKHWEPHETVPRLKRHHVLEAVVQDRLCQKHGRPLEVFCQNDQVCVCQLCSALDHRSHLVVPLAEEHGRRKAQVRETRDEVQHSIQEIRAKIQELKQSVKLSKDDADAKIADGMKVFTGLRQCIESMQASSMKSIEEQHTSTEKHAEGLMEELENEIVELCKRRSELDKLSHTEDHLQFLQNIPSLSTPVHTKNLTKINVKEPLFRDTLQTDLEQLEETLSIELKQLFKQIDWLKRYEDDEEFEEEEEEDKQVIGQSTYTKKKPGTAQATRRY